MKKEPGHFNIKYKFFKKNHDFDNQYVTMNLLRNMKYKKLRKLSYNKTYRRSSEKPYLIQINP